MPDDQHSTSSAPSDAQLRQRGSDSTCWSVILRAQGNDDSPEARNALGELLKRYESTIESMLRAHGAPRNTIKDLRQEFFVGVIRRKDATHLDANRGRFRSWLWVATRHFVLNERQKSKTPKHSALLIVETPPEQVDTATPELACMRKFAEETLERAIERHRAEARDPQRFDELVRFLRPSELPNVRELAERWEVPPNRLQVELHRLKERHAIVLRQYVADTLDVDPTDPAGEAAIDLELENLYRLLSEVPVNHGREDA